jgi:hypothetical protein
VAVSDNRDQQRRAQSWRKKKEKKNISSPLRGADLLMSDVRRGVQKGDAAFHRVLDVLRDSLKKCASVTY